MTDADAGKAVDVPPYALLPSNAPSRASSVLGASVHVTEDGDESDHSKSERMNLTNKLIRLFMNGCKHI